MTAPYATGDELLDDLERLTIPYRSPLQIGADTPDTPAWIMRGYAALQTITELDGKIKASGKTTLVTHLVAAVLDGQPFLGQPTMKTKVCYLTEQTPATFQGALHGFDRSLPQPNARAIRRVGRGDPPPVDFPQSHVDPEGAASQPQQDHGEGIAARPCRAPCRGDW